jgi:soluble P-type ATPase
MAILVDLNGTIASEGKPIQKTIDYLKTVTEDIYIISGSIIDKRKEYEALLERLGIQYVQLILSKEDQQTDLDYKLKMAKSIPDLSFAIDNNKNVVALYLENGIPAIFPHELVIPFQPKI